MNKVTLVLPSTKNNCKKKNQFGTKLKHFLVTDRNLPEFLTSDMISRHFDDGRVVCRSFSVHALEESGGDGRETLLRHVHVSFTYLQRLYQV